MSGKAHSALAAQTAEEIADCVAALDWDAIRSDVDAYGYSTTGVVLGEPECRQIRTSYDVQELFRSRIEMARHGFGRGEYKYFNYPLPALIETLRASLYERLAPIANAWNAALGLDACFPETHLRYIQRCHEAGQCKPTPLLLKYRKDRH